MGLEDEIGAARARRNKSSGSHAVLAALVTTMMMLSGLLSQAMASPEATDGHAMSSRAGPHLVDGAAPSVAAPDRTIHTSAIPAGQSRTFADLSVATTADRHIQTGILLLIVSLMAATSFSLWRWQLRGLVLEARHRDS